MAVDGISLPMLVLSALLTFLAVVASWKIDTKPKFYFAMLLLLQVGMNGVFLALDFVLFYVFWELVLVPMYFLIAQWGGPRREYAAIKFFLYTLLGSVFMLVGIVALYLKTGTFDMIALAAIGHLLPAGLQWWLFLRSSSASPSRCRCGRCTRGCLTRTSRRRPPASALLAGMLLKMGTYGFLRVSLPILPDGFAAWQWFLARARGRSRSSTARRSRSRRPTSRSSSRTRRSRTWASRCSASPRARPSVSTAPWRSASATA